MQSLTISVALGKDKLPSCDVYPVILNTEEVKATTSKQTNKQILRWYEVRKEDLYNLIIILLYITEASNIIFLNMLEDLIKSVKFCCLQSAQLQR